METHLEPVPWSCSLCGARLLWRRQSVDCPTHGPLAALPSWPAEETHETSRAGR